MQDPEARIKCFSTGKVYLSKFLTSHEGVGVSTLQIRMGRVQWLQLLIFTTNYTTPKRRICPQVLDDGRGFVGLDQVKTLELLASNEVVEIYFLFSF